MDKQFKVYRKANQDVFTKLSDNVISKIGSYEFTLPELVSNFRLFLKDSYLKLFEMVVKQVWLEQHVTYGGVRRFRRRRNGFKPEQAFCFFITGMVGSSHNVLMGNHMLTSLISYFDDFFPEFSKHNPFTEPEYYKYPYDHVSPDFLYVVKDHHERLEMLEYAEEKKMNIREFVNWAANQAICYNLEVGEDIYSLSRNKHFFVRIKKNK